jgi:hypothetical protein
MDEKSKAIRLQRLEGREELFELFRQVVDSFRRQRIKTK